MAKRKRALKSPPTSLPAKEERPKDPQDPTTALRRALPDQDHPAQEVRQDVPQSPCPRDLISMSNAANSPLLRLPAEIRNMIFTYVYADKTYVFREDLEAKATGTCRREDDESQSELKGEACLSFVCRQLNAETSLLPYKLGVFRFNVVAKNRGYLGLWMLEDFVGERTDQQFDAIAQLTIEQWSDEGRKDWERTMSAANWLATMKEIADCADQMNS